MNIRRKALLMQTTGSTAFGMAFCDSQNKNRSKHFRPANEESEYNVRSKPIYKSYNVFEKENFEKETKNEQRDLGKNIKCEYAYQNIGSSVSLKYYKYRAFGNKKGTSSELYFEMIT